MRTWVGRKGHAVAGKALDDGRAERVSYSTMKDAEFSPGYKRLLRGCLTGARGGLSVGFAISSATLALWLDSARNAWIAFAIAGATMSVVYWWVWGRIFKSLGLTVRQWSIPAHLPVPRKTASPRASAINFRTGRGTEWLMVGENYGETQLPPFCAQLDVSVPTVSATPE